MVNQLNGKSQTIFEHILPNLKTQPNEPVNASFLTEDSVLWFNYISDPNNYLPDPSKPIVFLPCANAQKTRIYVPGDPRKFISKSFTHDLMRGITKNETYERIILSEPLVIIPYSKESHPLRPDYNLPVSYLSRQSEEIFVRFLRIILQNIRIAQPERKYLYYIGGAHHSLILKLANLKIVNPFKIFTYIPVHGTKDYSRAADEFDRFIQLVESEYLTKPKIFQLEAQLPNISLGEFLKRKRGRYSHMPFWESIAISELLDQKTMNFRDSTIKIMAKTEIQNGYLQFYPEPLLLEKI